MALSMQPVEARLAENAANCATAMMRATDKKRGQHHGSHIRFSTSAIRVIMLWVMHESRDQQRNGLVLKGFVRQACGNDDLLEWAKEFCALGDAVKGQLNIYQGHRSQPGESFHQQLRRQLSESLQARGIALVDQSSVDPGSDMAKGSPAAANALFGLLQKLMRLHEALLEGPDGKRQDLRWKVKIEFNGDAACTKLHDDLVTVRLAMTLAGEGTVIANNNEVDWKAYDSSNGIIPALVENPDASLAEVRQIIQTWNQKVCQGELATEAGDVSIMKGASDQYWGQSQCCSLR